MKAIEHNLLKDLNKEQKAAVLCIENPVRILAGPGSGKTRVLTRKIAYLIEVANIDSNRILALTFTNKAANEMKSRVMDLVGKKAEKMIVSTFHSFCYHFLKEEISFLDNFSNNFAILDSIDQDNVLKEIYKKINLSKNEISYYSIKEYISNLKNQFIFPDPITEKELIKDNLEAKKIKQYIYYNYQNELKRSKSLDFDDLLVYTKTILESSKKICEKWANKFDYFLIDEFQDTSKIQYEIISLIAKNEKITIVGDPDQTIYSWRGADISFINNFDKKYKNVITITLFENYRSTKNILRIANNLIVNNSNRISKNLVTANDEGQIVEYYEGSSIDNESLWVSLQINKLKKEKNQLKDIAILYRSNFYSRSIEDALIKEQIPYKIINGQKFYERSEIKDVLAYLRCIYEPTNISLKRIINKPSRKLGETTLNKLVEFASKRNLSLWESWIKYINTLEISYDKKQNLFKFIEILRKYNVLIQKKEPIHLIIEKFLEEIGFIKMLEMDEGINSSRIDNIRELIKSIKIWENKNPKKYIAEYLDFVSLESINIEDSTNINYVSLMTIHASKGLEFKNVFVIGLNEGIFPSQKVIDFDNEEGESFMMEEERRLAYVAFTRAKSKLFLSSAKDSMYGGQFSSRTPSRFIEEINIKINKSKNVNEILNFTKKNNEFEPGDKITHINFGEGIVLDVNGDSIIIEFINKDVGIKQLLKNHKSIEKVI